MLFNSIHFLLFFPVALLGYFILPATWRNFWLLLASYYFYAAWKAEYSLLLLATSAFDYGAARIIAQKKSFSGRRIFLIISLSINIGVLFYFKYLLFFSELTGIFDKGFSFTAQQIILPLGISFYTFQSIAYMVDVYRKKMDVEKNFINYALFVVFFPQLVAGPIERAKHLIGQLKKKQLFDFVRINSGLRRMAWGMFKKVVVADRLALLVDPVFDAPHQFDTWVIWLAAFAFTFQILADFSGYSDIAIGAAKCFGINLIENFSAPYIAKSFTDFWRRWHISLSTWFRDYVYHPLGGNRKGKFNAILFLFITFFLSGLWHGAALTFVLFGCVHAVLIMAEFLFPALKEPQKDKFIWLFQIRTYLIFTASLVLFRASSLTSAKVLFTRMFSYTNGISLHDLHIPKTELLLMPMLVFLMEFFDRKAKANPNFGFYHWPLQIRLFAYSTLILLTIFLGVFESRQFIYFQF
jgi:alginate O-acetyltransferase complex protein AlgI